MYSVYFISLLLMGQHTADRHEANVQLYRKDAPSTPSD